MPVFALQPSVFNLETAVEVLPQKILTLPFGRNQWETQLRFILSADCKDYRRLRTSPQRALAVETNKARSPDNWRKKGTVVVVF